MIRQIDTNALLQYTNTLWIHKQTCASARKVHAFFRTQATALPPTKRRSLPLTIHCLLTLLLPPQNQISSRVLSMRAFHDLLPDVTSQDLAARRLGNAGYYLHTPSQTFVRGYSCWKQDKVSVNCFTYKKNIKSLTFCYRFTPSILANV